MAALGLGAAAAAAPRPVQRAALAATAAVGCTRVYLGVHWPSDVVAGWLLAAGWLALTGGAARSADGASASSPDGAAARAGGRVPYPDS
jgi:undecaprenyl-diphosphatase